MMRTSKIATAVSVGALGLLTNTAGFSQPVTAAVPHLSTPSSYAICPTDPSQPLTEPEALQSIDAYTTDGSAYAQQLSTGAGVKVAVLADGLDPNNPDFIRGAGAHVITDYRDFTGVGPDAPSAGGLAFGSVSAIADQGNVSYDLSNFTNPSYPLPAGCNIRLLGVAPSTSIVALRVGEPHAMSTSSIVQAINYAVNVAHVKVIDEPFAVNAFPDASSQSAIQQANDAAVAAGITVVEAAGDGGQSGTIGSDAADPQVISAGATDDGRLDAQVEEARFFGNGKWLDDSVGSASSGGVSEQGRTVDLVAPGADNWAACSGTAFFSDCRNFGSPPAVSSLQAFGGTAEASSLTAGVAALVISAYRSTHGAKTPRPSIVKQIITSTMADLGVSPAEQGAGLLDANAATEAALTWPGATKSAPASVTSTISTSQDQLVLAGTPGTTVSGAVSVRNVGSKKLSVAVGTRQLQVLATSAQATSFDATTLPTFPSKLGQPTAYKKLTFPVPSGGAELSAELAWAGTSSPADRLLHLALFAPDGTFAAASEPQGGVTSANSSVVTVRDPVAGTWTAVLTSPAGTAGYTGVAGLKTDTWKGVPVGSVTPAGFALKPGESRTVTVRRQLPKADTGDQSYALTLASSAGQQSAVAVIARPLLDPQHGHDSFSGAIIGGDGQPATPAQTATYPIAVPRNVPGLDASVTFADPSDGDPTTPGEPVEAMLIDPHGNLADLVSNNTLTAPDDEEPGNQIQAFVARPAAGRWLLVVAAANPVPGTEFVQDFTGRVRLRALTVTSTGLPASLDTALKSGSVHTVLLKVTNEGVQPQLLGLDPRAGSYATYQPVPVTGQQTVVLPADPSTEPTYSIPPDTRSFTVTASSNPHTQLEIYAPGRGIDAIGSLGQAETGSLSRATATAPASGSFLVRGLWGTSLQETGPFTDDGAATGQSTLTGSLSTLAFNPTISSGVDDPYRDALLGTFTNPPVFLMPGQTTTLTAHLKVRAPRGTHVFGLLNLVTVPSQPTQSATSLPARTTGEVVATLPFQYTVAPLPKLSIRAPRSVRRGAKLVAVVRHGGAAVRGATVTFEGHRHQTNGKGKATFRVGGHARAGKATINAALAGYASAHKNVTVKS